MLEKMPSPLRSRRALSFGIVLLLCVLAVACTGRKNSGESDTASGNGAASPYGGHSVGDSLFFSLERTPCLGMCKAYRINVYRSGHATYEGVVHVERMGMHRTRIGGDTLRTLLEEAERIGFWELNATYDGPVTDLPSTIIRVVSGESDHTVTARVKTPPAFRAFAEFADELLVPNAWKPVQLRD